ncbi:MAG: SDR family oxidoreductase [Pseudonocardiales bacterium]
MNWTSADLTGRRPLVSGGASDIGAAGVRLLAQAGAHVTVLDVNADQAAQLAEGVGGDSVHGHRASPFRSAYVAAKHGLEGLSKVIALEGGPNGVTSDSTAPGYVRSGLVEGQIDARASVRNMSRDGVVEQVMLSETVIKRLIEPDEDAQIAAFLCTSAASDITGTSVAVDGGWTAR